jgi:hypothetical protein
MCRSRDGSTPHDRVQNPRSRRFCNHWQKRAAIPPQRARDLPDAVALSHCLNQSWSRYAKRRRALAPAARRRSSQAKPEGRAPRRRGTRILQSERDSLPPSISPQHTPRNDRSRVCRRLGCHHSWRRCLGTPAGDERCPRSPPRRVQEQHHRRCFPPWQFGLAGLQQTVRRRDQSSLGERTLRTALRCIRLTVSNRSRRMVGGKDGSTGAEGEK